MNPPSFYGDEYGFLLRRRKWGSILRRRKRRMTFVFTEEKISAGFMEEKTSSRLEIAFQVITMTAISAEAVLSTLLLST